MNNADTGSITVVFATKPTTAQDLNAVMNRLKLKHVMLRVMLWDSLTASFQLEIIGNETVFKEVEEYDGVKL